MRKSTDALTIAAALGLGTLGCLTAKRSGEVFIQTIPGNFEVVGNQHSVADVRLVKCAKFITVTVKKDDTYTSIAEGLGASDNDVAVYANVTRALDDTPDRLSAGEEITTVDVSWCQPVEIIPFDRAFEQQLDEQSGYINQTGQNGTAALAIYGFMGNDPLAKQMSRSEMIAVFIEQP